MDYHEPDNTWTIWVDNFDDFARRWVFKGRFHQDAPKDVVKSYRVAEYIMAHSRYHYPLYDGAHEDCCHRRNGH
jgi:hypothetical protein